MKKVALSIFIILLFNVAKAQPQVARGQAFNTPTDINLFTTSSFKLPVFSDTTTANLAVTLDSCGKMIFTRDVNAVWYRQCSPKKWILLSNGNAPVYTADRGVKIIGDSLIRLTDTVQGAGTKFQYLYDKAAFRVGSVNGTQWDIANVGLNSFASGINTIASGTFGIAMGTSSQATGIGSVAIGSVALSTASQSTALGNTVTASGSSSLSTGLSTTASGSVSTATGNFTKAVGNNSFSGGVGTYMNTLNGFVVGAYNDTTNYYLNNTSAQVATDPIFTIGNGSGVGSRSNAFQMLRNGATKFSSGITTTTDTTTFKPMVMDASGNVRKTGTWGAGNNNVYNINGTQTGNRVWNANNKYLHIDSLSGLNFFSYGVAVNAGLPYRMKSFMVFDSDENEGASINTDYINGTQSETRSTIRTTGVNGLTGMYAVSVLSGFNSKVEVDTSSAYIQTQDSIVMNTTDVKLHSNLYVENKLSIQTGTNKTAGKATMVLGTVTVNTTQVGAASIILLTAQETGTLVGNLRVSARVAGTSFTITSTDLTDTAEVGWLIIN